MAKLKDMKLYDYIINLDNNVQLAKLYYKSKKGAMIAHQHFCPKKKNEEIFVLLISSEMGGNWISLNDFMSKAEFVGRMVGLNKTELESNIMLFRTSDCVLVYNLMYKEFYFYAGNGQNKMSNWLKGDYVIENTPEKIEQVKKILYSKIEKDFTIDADICKRINEHKIFAEQYLKLKIKKTEENSEKVEYDMAILDLISELTLKINENNPKILEKIKSGKMLNSENIESEENSTSKLFN